MRISHFHAAFTGRITRVLIFTVLVLALALGTMSAQVLTGTLHGYGDGCDRRVGARMPAVTLTDTGTGREYKGNHGRARQCDVHQPDQRQL